MTAFSDKFECARHSVIDTTENMIFLPILKYTLIKKENQIFLIYEEIQDGAVAKSYMTNGLLVKYGEIFAQHLIFFFISYLQSVILIKL
jgi:hypothetical protein